MSPSERTTPRHDARSMPILAELARIADEGPLTDAAALALADAGTDLRTALLAAASARRDRAWGRRITFSPKVFLPVTNLCPNVCEYCSFRRSPGKAGAWTMTPAEIDDALARARALGCAEALLCLGDKPERAFPSYQRQLATWGHDGTVAYLEWTAGRALDHGLLPHTNAGVLTRAEMIALKRVNVSLGLMLEHVSPRLCEPGMPHHRAPDKDPARRLEMLEEAGALAIPFTTGILVGIGETAVERVESLLAIRRIHLRFGHIQEVIVQPFRAHASTRMAGAPEPDDDTLAHAIALARLVLPDDVSVQAPPNLARGGLAVILGAGVNDLGGISPVTPDYINPRHPWPELDTLADACAREGFTLRPRAAVYDSYVTRPGFLDDALRAPTERVQARLASVVAASALVMAPSVRGEVASCAP